MSKQLIRNVRQMKKLLSMPTANAAVGSHNNYFTYVNELSHPLPREPPIVSPEEAVACIKSGKSASDSGGCRPQCEISAHTQCQNIAKW